MRLYMTVAALLGWLALLLQLYLMVGQSPAGALAISATIVSYFSFFTLLSNFIVTLTLTFALWGGNSTWGRFFSRPSVQAAAVVYIAIVGVSYSLLLRHLWNPQGAQKLADVLLHDLMPVIYVLYWIIFAPKKGLRWKDATVWLLYPAIYLVYILLRGALFGLYPYPFIDAGELGYPRMLVNASLFFVIFLGLGLLVAALGRWRAGIRGPEPREPSPTFSDRR